MRRLTFITGLVLILSLLFVSTGCGDDEDIRYGCHLADTFSLIIVDENDVNLLDSDNPYNIIDKVEMDVVCSNGKIIPVQWVRGSAFGAPGHSKDDPYAFDYEPRDSRLIVGYWDSNFKWATSFKIRIPAYNIELNVTGHRKLFTSWQVDGVSCGTIFKLTLPIK